MAGRGTYRPGAAGTLAAVRSVLFYIWIALATLVMGVVWLPFVLIRPVLAHSLGRAWSGHLLAAARVLLGLRVEVRGTPPTGSCIIAAKHQSFLDILAIAHAVPRCAFIMKRELLRVPVMGYYAVKAGCIPIDRSRGPEAMQKIVTEIESIRARPQGMGQLIIYPEGTRTKPGQKVRYKHGVSAIYAMTGLPIVPVAVNCGLFWPKKSFVIRPGTSIIEFLPVIAAGQEAADVMVQLTQKIEGASDKLLAEAGWPHSN